MKDVKLRVLNVVEEVLGVSAEEVDLNASIRQELAPDSLDQVTLFMTLSDEFGDTISQDEADRINSLADTIELIKRKLK